MEFSDDVEIIEIVRGSSSSNTSSSKAPQTNKRGFRQRSAISYDHNSSDSSTAEEDSDGDFQPSKKKKFSQPNISFVVQKKKSSKASKKQSQTEKLKREEEKQRKKEEQERKKKEKEEEKQRKKKEKEDARIQKENDPKVLAAKQRKKDKEAKELKKQKETERYQGFMKNFLVPKKPFVIENRQFKNSDSPLKSSPLFKPFEIKTNMALSPLHRRQISILETRKLDEELKQESPFYSKDELLNQSRNSKRKCDRTIVNQDISIITTEDDRILEDSQGLVKYKFKLLQFYDNKKPPFFGTCKQRRLTTGPRKPFAKENGIEYDSDSEDEFDEPSDGESIDAYLKKDVHDNDKDEPMDEADNDILDSEDETTYDGNYITPNTFSVPTIETKNLYKYKLIKFPMLETFQDNLSVDDDNDDIIMEEL